MKQFLVVMGLGLCVAWLPACFASDDDSNPEPDTSQSLQDSGGNLTPDQNSTTDSKPVADQNSTTDSKPVADQSQYTPPGTWKTISTGTFQMGSPTTEKCREPGETQHQVTLTRKFAILTTEVTQSMFTQVLGYSPSAFKSCGSTCPVEQVTWHEAVAYCNALTSKAGLAPCYTCSGSGAGVACQEATAYSGLNIYKCPGYRLPTEAEWEYAYRAGSTTALYNGDMTVCAGKDNNAEKISWYQTNAGKKTHPVGTKAPNAWGLYDMAGNVWEWCNDRGGAYPTSAVTDPVSSSGSNRVIRGGSWATNGTGLRAAYRHDKKAPTSRLNEGGFRCVRTVK